MDRVFFFSLTLPARIFSLSFSIFLSFWREKKGSFPSFFLLFSFWGGEGAGDRKNEVFFLFPLFFLSFCFFSSVFLMIFSLFSFYLLFWEWEKENEISVISSLFSSFWGRKMRGATGKKEGSAFYFSS